MNTSGPVPMPELAAPSAAPLATLAPEPEQANDPTIPLLTAVRDADDKPKWTPDQPLMAVEPQPAVDPARLAPPTGQPVVPALPKPQRHPNFPPSGAPTQQWGQSASQGPGWGQPQRPQQRWAPPMPTGMGPQPQPQPQPQPGQFPAQRSPNWASQPDSQLNRAPQGYPASQHGGSSTTGTVANQPPQPWASPATGYPATPQTPHSTGNQPPQQSVQPWAGNYPQPAAPGNAGAPWANQPLPQYPTQPYAAQFQSGEPYPAPGSATKPRATKWKTSPSGFAAFLLFLVVMVPPMAFLSFPIATGLLLLYKKPGRLLTFTATVFYLFIGYLWWEGYLPSSSLDSTAIILAIISLVGVGILHVNAEVSGPKGANTQVPPPGPGRVNY